MVAGGGVLHPPLLVRPETLPPGERIITRAAAANVRGLMREAVQHGTGRAADIPQLDVCGKTGTAQNPGGADHAWFTCFASGAEPPWWDGAWSSAAIRLARRAAIAVALLEEALRLGSSACREVPGLSRRRQASLSGATGDSGTPDALCC